MSELDLIFNRRKKEEGTEKTVENKIEEEKKAVEVREEKKEEIPQSQQETQQKDTSSIEMLMKKFIDKDPKIGIWSYPSYLLLQYLYNTIPGFKMSRTAKEALERGLKEMYPELYSIAEKVAKEAGKI